MRERLFDIAYIGRAAGFMLVAVALLASAIQLDPDQSTRLLVRTVVAPQSDPLLHEISRCESLGLAAEQDASCDAAWSENHQRFYTYAPAAQSNTSRR
jgi:conjugative transfer region protein TrbK